MWSKRLENKIAKNRAYGKEILAYANSILGVGLQFTSVNKLAIEFETWKQIAIKERKMWKQIDLNEPKIREQIEISKQKLQEQIEIGKQVTGKHEVPVIIEQGTDKQSIPPFIQELEKMIEQYRKTSEEIEGLKKREKTRGVSANNSRVPKNPHIEQIAKTTKGILQKWVYGRYRCFCLEKFVKEYLSIIAKLPQSQVIPLKPAVIRNYLIRDETSAPYSKGYIDNTLNQYRPKAEKKKTNTI